MRSPSIEWLHAKLEKHIRLTESYTEISGLEFIIKACRLKPYDYIFKKRKDNIILYRDWFDEFGNSFKIDKDKEIKITYNDLSLDKEKIISTDLYYGLSLTSVAKMSRYIHIIIGKDDDTYQDCFIVSFVGIDNHLRSYLYLYGELRQVSPLLLGMQQLQTIANRAGMKPHEHFELKEKLPIPCTAGNACLSCLPMSKELIKTIKQHDSLMGVLF